MTSKGEKYDKQDLIASLVQKAENELKRICSQIGIECTSIKEKDDLERLVEISNLREECIRHLLGAEIEETEKRCLELVNENNGLARNLRKLKKSLKINNDHLTELEEQLGKQEEENARLQRLLAYHREVHLKLQLQIKDESNPSTSLLRQSEINQLRLEKEITGHDLTK